MGPSVLKKMVAGRETAYTSAKFYLTWSVKQKMCMGKYLAYPRGCSCFPSWECAWRQKQWKCVITELADVSSTQHIWTHPWSMAVILPAPALLQSPAGRGRNSQFSGSWFRGRDLRSVWQEESPFRQLLLAAGVLQVGSACSSACFPVPHSLVWLWGPGAQESR